MLAACVPTAIKKHMRKFQTLVEAKQSNAMNRESVRTAAGNEPVMCRPIVPVWAQRQKGDRTSPADEPMAGQVVELVIHTGFPRSSGNTPNLNPVTGNHEPRNRNLCAETRAGLSHKMRLRTPGTEPTSHALQGKVVATCGGLRWVIGGWYERIGE